MNYWVSGALLWVFVYILYIHIIFMFIHILCLHMYIHIMHFNISTLFLVHHLTLLDQMALGCFFPSSWLDDSHFSNFTTLQQNAQRILGFKVVPSNGDLTICSCFFWQIWSRGGQKDANPKETPIHTHSIVVKQVPSLLILSGRHLLQTYFGKFNSQKYPGIYHMNGPIFLSLQKHFGKFVWAFIGIQEFMSGFETHLYDILHESPKIQQKIRSIPIKSY